MSKSSVLLIFGHNNVNLVWGGGSGTRQQELFSIGPERGLSGKVCDCQKSCDGHGQTIVRNFSSGLAGMSLFFNLT